MALIDCDFYSDVLKVSTSMTVVLPRQTRSQIGMTDAVTSSAPPVLYLLHGLSDDHTTWVRRTSIERYAAPLGLAVVMPAVHRSFYADETHGHRYWTFLSEELPQVVEAFFRVSQRREETFVAGLSMGGYGALKWALREPHHFAGVASMSGALDLRRLGRRPERAGLVQRVFGGTPGRQDDLLALLASADISALPPVHLSCGTQDVLIQDNREFAQAARQAGAQLTEDFHPGEHEWGFWDAEIQTVLEWLPGLSSRAQPDT